MRGMAVWCWGMFGVFGLGLGWVLLTEGTEGGRTTPARDVGDPRGLGPAAGRHEGGGAPPPAPPLGTERTPLPAGVAEWMRYPRTRFDPVERLVAVGERCKAERLYRNRILNPRDRVFTGGQRRWIADLVATYRARLARLRADIARVRREEILARLAAGTLPEAAPRSAPALAALRQRGWRHYRRLLRARARRHPEEAPRVRALLEQVGPEDIVPVASRPDLRDGDSLVVVRGRGRYVAPRGELPRTRELEEEYEFVAREMVALLATRYHALRALTSPEYRAILARLYPEEAAPHGAGGEETHR